MDVKLKVKELLRNFEYPIWSPVKEFSVLSLSPTSRVQKKSRLNGSEPEENFALYDVFEEGCEICINNSVSAKFLYNATSNVKGIAHLQ